MRNIALNAAVIAQDYETKHDHHREIVRKKVNLRRQNPRADQGGRLAGAAQARGSGIRRDQLAIRCDRARSQDCRAGDHEFQAGDKRGRSAPASADRAAGLAGDAGAAKLKSLLKQVDLFVLIVALAAPLLLEQGKSLRIAPVTMSDASADYILRDRS